MIKIALLMVSLSLLGCGGAGQPAGERSSAITSASAISSLNPSSVSSSSEPSSSASSASSYSSQRALTAADFSDSQAATDLWIYTNNRVPISPQLFGVNNDWRRISSAQYPAFIDQLEGIGYQNLRFPGGWESEYYDWEANDTPTWENRPTVAGASIESVLTSLPPSLSIVVPTVWAMDVALNGPDWNAQVKRCQDLAVLAINKTGAQNILTVEIGNEWWLQWGGGVTRAEKLEKYAYLAKAIAKHIKTQFPQAKFKVLVNGDITAPQEFTVINTVFKDDLKYIDGLTLHPYAGYLVDEGHGIAQLGPNIKASKDNLGKPYVYLSEWAPARAYNGGKIYAQAANVLVGQMYEFARAGANAAAYWPPTNPGIPGLGLFDYSLTKRFPASQIFEELANNFTGAALGATDGSMRVIASRNQNTVVAYIVGNDEAWTTVNLQIAGSDITQIIEASVFEPGNLNDSAAAVLMTQRKANYARQGNTLTFYVNKNSAYSIYKLVLTVMPR